jgi:hypothetical protein
MVLGCGGGRMKRMKLNEIERDLGIRAIELALAKGPEDGGDFQDFVTMADYCVMFGMAEDIRDKMKNDGPLTKQETTVVGWMVCFELPDEFSEEDTPHLCNDYFDDE